MLRRLLLLLCLSLRLYATASTDIPLLPLQAEQWPCLHVPRIAHVTMVLPGGEVLVAGGHTTGFVPTPTAEYYSDGEWHTVTMTYTHDGPLAAMTADSLVLIAGGAEKPLGIGQTFSLERFNPRTHTFEGYGCLWHKRFYAQALPLDSSRIVIAGNWYANDSIECYDGSRQNTMLKGVSQRRSLPYILRTARDNAIIFGSHDIHGNTLDTIIIDRLRGEPYSAELFREWRPFWNQVGFTNGAAFVGDEQQGRYDNLFLVTSKIDGHLAVALAEGDELKLLPTVHPIPMLSPMSGSPIEWFLYIVADRSVQKAYIVGFGSAQNDHRAYVASIAYNERPAAIQLLYTEPLPEPHYQQPVLLPSGDLLIAGGWIEANNNYKASSSVLLLHTGRSIPDESHFPLWLLIAIGVVATVVACTFIWLRQRKEKSIVLPTNANGQPTAADNATEHLIRRICQLMDEQQIYLNSELKVSDVARQLGTNSKYISSAINQQRGCSFSQFVNIYRVEHAQRLMRQHPDKKINEIWMSSGFGTETSFFRNFKAVTGKTPKEPSSN